MGDLRKRYDEAVKASGLIEPTDAALVEAGRKLADQIEYASKNCTGQELTKALYLTPHLLNVLREMHATPASRIAAGIGEKESSGGKLAQLRAVHGGKAG